MLLKLKLKFNESRTFEERVFQNALDAPERLDHVRAVVVQIPELAVVALVRPPALWRVSRRGARGLSRRPGARRRRRRDGRSTRKRHATTSTLGTRPRRGPNRLDIEAESAHVLRDAATLPERVLPQHLILFKVGAAAPACVLKIEQETTHDLV